MRAMPWMVGTVCVAGMTLGGSALAQPVPDYDFDWATVGDVGNPAYDGIDPFDQMLGRGSVDYAYRISKLEITTTQWIEYVNTFSTQSDDLRLFSMPSSWGARRDSSYTGPGWKWKLDTNLISPEVIPVYGLSWREAARYTNWLHNDKGAALSALDSGAYDTSTWSDPGVLPFTDDFTHLPDARFWIPTLDEWVKAAHFDPNGNGSGQPRWWMYPNGTDEPVPPDQTSAGHGDSGDPGVRLDFLVGMFPQTQSPYGLLDVSGGATEWIEEVSFADDPRNRNFMGSSVLDGLQFYEIQDRVYLIGGAGIPWFATAVSGLRIASAVPTPASGIPIVLVGGMFIQHRRRS